MGGAGAVAAGDGLFHAAVWLVGATGFVGRPLVRHLVAAGHHCLVLSRQEAQLLPQATILGYDHAWAF